MEKLKINFELISKISTTRQLYCLLSLIKETGHHRINCSLVYINRKTSDDILNFILNNAKKNKNLYNVKWRMLKETLIDDWKKYSPNVDDRLNVPYDEIWLMDGWDCE